MTFTQLLIHTADVYTVTETNTGGRVTETWTKQATIPCRFSTPVSSRVNPADGVSIERIDAVVFTGPDLTISHLPVRFVTTDAGWAGTYEMREKPRIICASSSAVHHCECDCREVFGNGP